LAGTGEGLQILFKEPNPFLATFVLRVEPRREGAGNSFALNVDVAIDDLPAENALLQRLEHGFFDCPVKAGGHLAHVHIKR
ncbi:hypothetical protein ACC692_38165, partial [Rhizobium ruizarguesonis]